MNYGLRHKKKYKGLSGYNYVKCYDNVKTAFLNRFLSFQTGKIDRLGGKISKWNQEEFVFYVDFVFV